MTSGLIFLKQSLNIRSPPNILCDTVKELACIADEWVPKAIACYAIKCPNDFHQFHVFV